MTLASELMSAGQPARLAELIGQDAVSTPQTATGTTQATAFAIASKFTLFGTVGASSGAILPTRGRVLVVNNGANALSVYPPVGGNINGGTLNAAFSVTNAKSALFESNGLTWFAILSA